MLRIGLTGGIGSGKSTVSRRLAEHGAAVVDADALAREVVGPGEEALTRIRERFGAGVFATDGTLDRPALGRLVFGDPQALSALEAITHPAIRERTALRFADAMAAGVRVGVHDVPLLVEQRLAAEYHLVIVVDTHEEVRVDRLIEHRGTPEAEARSRIAAQASDAQRRAVADVLLDNDGTPEALELAVDRQWRERILPFAEHLERGASARLPGPPRLVEVDPHWPARAERVLARLARVLGEDMVTGHHIGSTAVPLPAKDVLDLQVGVRDLRRMDEAEVTGALHAAGFPRVVGIERDHAKDGTVWPKRLHGGCDPAQVVQVHLREVDSPGWRWALLFRDALRADPGLTQDYLAEKRRLAAAGLTASAYAEAKEPWFAEVAERLEAWAERTGWTPPAGR